MQFMVDVNVDVSTWRLRVAAALIRIAKWTITHDCEVSIIESRHIGERMAIKVRVR